nr:centromere protein J [Misgurnus anguillicaudatus]XP_055070438.1 centromere protein J [Misgurnus anguillicaudatus]XP_055070440.1 centromere protein J [Misgurnus anguillicaudatus]
MSSPAGLQHFLSQWMPNSSRAGVILHGSPGSIRSSGSPVVRDPDDSFSSHFAPLPVSLCSSVDTCSPGEVATEQFDASLSCDMQSIQDMLRNTRDLPLIAKLEQLKQMQHRMQEQLKTHQQEQQLRLQHEQQSLQRTAQNTTDSSMWNIKQSMVEPNTEHDDSNHEYEDSFQSMSEDHTVHGNECETEPLDRPIRSGFSGKTFEEMLEEQLRMEDQKLTAKNASAETAKVKRPFLKRGEGLARFTKDKSAALSHRKHPSNPKPPPCPNPKSSQDSDMRSKKNSNKTEALKSTHLVIHRKTATLNKENVPQNKTTMPVTKTTVRPPVLGAHQGQNVSSISAPFKRDRKSEQNVKSVTTTDANKMGACNREDGNNIAENSFEVWFAERGTHWEQDHQRECVELGEFELLERAADEISFSSNSSFISTLLHRGCRRLSSTPIKSSNQSTPPSRTVTEAPGPEVGHTTSVPPTNTVITRDVNTLKEKDLMGVLSDAKMDDKDLNTSLCSNSELQPPISNPPLRHCFQVPTVPYDKRTYQDRDGVSSPEGDDANSCNSKDSTLIDSKGHLEFDDDDTWNEPEEVDSCPVEESPSKRALKRKVAFSKDTKSASVSPNAENENKGLPTCPLVSKMFPALNPIASSPVTVQAPQNMHSEGAAQSSLLRERLVELETEIERFKRENADLSKLKQENQDVKENLRKERAEFEKKRLEDIAKWEEFKREENKKLQRERKLFEKHAAAVRARPDKQERDEIQALKQQVNALQEDLRKREARWSNTHSRLRQQVDALSSENASLRDQVRTLEKLRLSVWKSAENEREKRSCASGSKISAASISKSPSQSSKSSLSKNGSPETKSPPKNSGPYSETMKESIGFKNDHSPMEGSDGLDLTESNFDASLMNSIHTAATEHSKQEQEEIMHSDNKIEKVLPDGGRLIIFPNGTRKEISADGQTVKVTFFNGDVKHNMPDQRVIYYYAEAQTTHITYPDGMEVLQFPNNQTEKHFPDGRKEITFPDQTVKNLYPDGREESVLTDGTIIQLNPDGSKVIQFNTGQREVHTADFKRREYPDGTVKTVYSDGRQETQYPTGRVRLKDAQGHIIMDTKA